MRQNAKKNIFCDEYKKLKDCQEKSVVVNLPLALLSFQRTYRYIIAAINIIAHLLEAKFCFILFLPMCDRDLLDLVDSERARERGRMKERMEDDDKQQSDCQFQSFFFNNCVTTKQITLCN